MAGNLKVVLSRVVKRNTVSNKIIRHLHSNIIQKNLKIIFSELSVYAGSFLVFQVLIMQSQEHLHDLVKGKKGSNLQRLSSKDWVKWKLLCVFGFHSIFLNRMNISKRENERQKLKLSIIAKHFCVRVILVFSKCVALVRRTTANFLFLIYTT